MIIKFNKDITLSEWYTPGKSSLRYYRYLQVEGDSDTFMLVRIYSNEEVWFVAFYDHLNYLNNIWDSRGDMVFKETSLDLQADIVKKEVDNFLIKMSGLTAFI
jgi:hypothetical protein